MSLPQSSISILSLTYPPSSPHQIHTTLRPQTPQTLSKSTSLSFSFHNGPQEVFVDRLAYRDLDIQHDGHVFLFLPSFLPSFLSSSHPTRQVLKDTRQPKANIIFKYWSTHRLIHRMQQDNHRNHQSGTKIRPGCRRDRGQDACLEGGEAAW